MEKTRETNNGKILMDGNPVSWDWNEGESLADVLDRVIGEMSKERTVVAVKLNGNPASRTQVAACPKGDFILEIESEALSLLLEEVLSDLTHHIDSLLVVFGEIGANLRRGNLAAVFGSAEGKEETGGVYMQGLEGIVATQVLVEEVGRIERHAGHDTFRLYFIEENDRIDSLLSGMLGAQENQDWILLADLVEYEILPILQRGRKKAAEALARQVDLLREGNRVVA
ncbi:MAG: hypothetical protein ACP5OP_03880 [Leptospirillia bacterium]